MNRGLSTGKAFTLIELLTVVAIIALLVSILLPCLQKARWHANRVYCLTNIKEQYISQILYADDHNGRFATHNEGNANYSQNWVCWPPEEYDFTDLFSAMKPYVKDPDILICPLLRQLGGAFEDSEYLSRNAMSGGWNSNASQYVYSGYCWFANLKDGRDPRCVEEFLFKFKTRSFMNTILLVNEPSWPESTQECSSDRAFIAHTIVSRNLSKPNRLRDQSHGGVPDWYDYDTAAPMTIDNIFSVENPVGYADGHVEIHQKSQFRPRARAVFSNGSYETYIY